MNIKFNLILILTLSLTSCNKNLKKIDFDSLPIEYMNSIESSELNSYKYHPLPPEIIISSSTNKFNLSTDLVNWGDSILIDLGKHASYGTALGEWGRFCTFTLGIITNKRRFKAIEIELDNSENDVLYIEHISTEFAIKDEEFIKYQSYYRYPCILKYHFKISINKQNELCEGMKHLVFVDDYLIYSPTKMK